MIELNQAGIYKLVVLGGSKVIGSLLKEDLINELQLTISPKLIAGKHSWIPKKYDSLPKQFLENDAWELNEAKILTNNELLLRYIRSYK